MASLRTLPGSRYWIAIFRDGAGKQFHRSTRVPVAGVGQTPKDRGRDAAEKRRQAQLIADQYESTSRGHPTEAQVQKVLLEICGRVNKRRIEPAITETFVATWLKKVKTRRGDGRTLERYEAVTRRFLDSLGPRKPAQLRDIAPTDVQQFVDSLIADGKAPATVRIEHKIVSSLFADAFRQGLTPTNPAAGVAVPLDAGETRRPFDWTQVRDLLAATETLASEAATPGEAREAREWKTLILLGAYTAARLGDCCAMCWDHVDLPSKVIRFRPSKTKAKGEELVVPIHPDLETHLLELKTPEGPDAGKQPLCPTLAAVGIGGRSGLSRKFQQLIGRAGIENSWKREGTGKGRSVSAFSFHSLRHAFNSTLMNSGVGEDLRMRLSGHASEEMNRRYSHAEVETLRAAVSKLPGVRG